ncbi:MAG: PQQ-binding-like beta-propeller repeat protein, partial [Roseibacillus sp.]|nr:PQQ-binding-like beta-propeller repeat protein [Roseibacillus sp.]
MKLLPLVLFAALSAGVLPAAESWPQFRGPGGAATAPEGAKIPVEWSESRNLRWKTAIPGPGSSSPIFTGNRLYVTCYTGYGTNREEVGAVRDLGRQLLCLDRSNGKILWKKA